MPRKKFPAILVAPEIRKPRYQASLTQEQLVACCHMVRLRRSMHFRAWRDHESPGMIDVLRDEPDDGRLNRVRVHCDDRLAGDEPAKRRVHGTQRLWFGHTRRCVGEKTDGSESGRA